MIRARFLLGGVVLAASNSGAQQNSAPPPDAPASWCTDGQSEYLSFQLGENGKTASICEQDGVLTYAFGHLDGEPELRYSGKEIAGFRFPGVIVGFGEMNVSLASLAADTHAVVNARRWPWSQDAREPGELIDEMERLAESANTGGFVVVEGLTGFAGSVSYLFRNGGWEYAIGAMWGRPIQVPEDELDLYKEHSITVSSPDGRIYRVW